MNSVEINIFNALIDGLNDEKIKQFKTKSPERFAYLKRLIDTRDFKDLVGGPTPFIDGVESLREVTNKGQVNG